MTGGTSPLQQLGPAFADYVTRLRSAWSRELVPDRAGCCREAMERLLGTGDPMWASAMDGVAGADGPVELYRDPDIGFVQMAHPYRSGHTSPPHGHGAGGWVVYGVERGRVEIATYETTDGEPPLETARAELLGAGEARVYLPGELHSTRLVSGQGAAGSAVVLRLLSEDLSKLERRRYQWQDVAVGA